MRNFNKLHLVKYDYVFLSEVFIVKKQNGVYYENRYSGKLHQWDRRRAF